jgi:hypothetical protein
MKIENRNFLSPIGFKFTIDRMRGVEFFPVSLLLFPLSLLVQQTHPLDLIRIKNPGDELQYEDLSFAS